MYGTGCFNCQRGGIVGFKHWKVERDDGGVATLAADVEGKSVNVLTLEALRELDAIVGDLEGDASLTGMILVSAKPGGFVYGADIREFEELEDEEQVGGLMDEVHALFKRIAGLPVPTVAGIDGYALGGGLELSLTCDRLVATAGPKTCLGYPEVHLGLLPGYGGTGRAWARVGSAAVIDMMVTGRMVQAAEAKELGLVDALADGPGELPGALRSMLESVGGRKPAARANKESKAETAKAAEAARERYLKGLRPDHTPAQFAIIDHVEKFSGDPDAMSEGEKEIFPALMMSPGSDGLRRLFHLNDLVKKAGRGDSGIASLHVIGAGVMGGDIAAVAAMRGLAVTISDLSEEAVAKAVDRARALYERRLKTPGKVDAAMARLAADADGLARADLVIEAVSENPEVKRAIFAEVEAGARPDAVLATNTSAIPLEEIAAALKDPSRLIGLHFFNPATVLPLVEVIWSEASDQRHVERGMFFAGALGKMPIRCKSAPGFMVNRALLPYMLKGIGAMLGGTEADKIDQALVDFGMPMGPIELADQVGLDVTHDASVPLGLPGEVAAALKGKVDKGELGRKTGSGFYEWDDRRAVRPRAAYAAAELEAMARELLSPMVDECLKAVEEGVVDSGDHADAGMILGVGFPGFRGGPLHCRKRGIL